MSGPFAKNSWICCVAISALALSLALPGELAAKKRKPRAPEELTNFLLGPDYARWLVGPISHIASDSEIESYLRLDSDQAAAEFIEAFWADRRSPEVVWPAPQPQGVFETRAREADTLYTEGSLSGRRSDRGTVYILYGEPAEVRYEVAARPGLGPIEVWVYPKDAERGLDGETPKRYYYFVKKGEHTVTSPNPPRQRLRPRTGGR